MANRITGLALFTGCLLASLGVVQTAHAAVWTELNAGATPATAEAVVGNPAEVLIRIQGTINPSTDPVDLYRISIANASAFSALTTNGGSTDDDLQFDAKLALFRANALGVYTNETPPPVTETRRFPPVTPCRRPLPGSTCSRSTTTTSRR